MEEGKKKLEHWLINNRDVLNIKGIENKIACPNATLQKVTKGERGLADQWVEPLKKIADNLKI